MSEETNYNNFKSTTVRGNFTNADYEDDSGILAEAIFNRNLTVKGNLILDTNVSIKSGETYQTISATQLLTGGGTLEIIDQFVMYYDQFTPGSVYEWAFL